MNDQYEKPAYVWRTSLCRMRALPQVLAIAWAIPCLAVAVASQEQRIHNAASPITQAAQPARAAAERPAPRAIDKPPDEPFDLDKVRALRRRALAGEDLSTEEREYLERARQFRSNSARGVHRGAQSEAQAPLRLIPLTDLTAEATYQEQEGGLYGGGKNEPPPSHLRAALEQVANIQPLDAHGRPAGDGKIVLISNGMSNTTQEFQAFMQLAAVDPRKSPSVVIVDGAQGGMDALDWAHPERRVRPDRPSPWEVLEHRLRQADITPEQVQVVWIKQARRNPASLGDFPSHAEELKDNLATILRKLQSRFPNLRLAYLSSRIYAGFATTPLNPEPYAYESAFSVRWLIQDQIRGEPGLNYDPEKGGVRAPLALWGPYLWADGTDGRKTDHLVWKREDLAGDGTHPSSSGRQKAGELLLEFFLTDPTAKPWFARTRAEARQP